MEKMLQQQKEQRYWTRVYEGQLQAGISDLPALDGPFIHPKAAQHPKLLFVTASSRFRGRPLSPW